MLQLQYSVAHVLLLLWSVCAHVTYKLQSQSLAERDILNSAASCDFQLINKNYAFSMMIS